MKKVISFVTMCMSFSMAQMQNPCTECHGDPKGFNPYPASLWINENNCGMCHP